MSHSQLSRRKFLGEASCAAVTSVPVLSTLLNLQLAGRVAAQGAPTDRKSLVCIFLSGGCDTYNVFVPTDPERHAEYTASRSNLAHTTSALVPLDHSDAGATYGLHPSCTKLAELFNGIGGDPTLRRLSVVTNIGTLIERLETKADFKNGHVPLPKALFSHRDQIEQWQTSVPQGQTVLSGWAGRAADILHATANNEQTGGYYMPMGFSLSGNSALLTGTSEGQFAITSNGALSFTSPLNSSGGVPVLSAKNAALKKLMTPGTPVGETYRNLFQQSLANTTGNAVERGEEFQSHFDTIESENVDLSAVDNTIKTKLNLTGTTTTLGTVLNRAGFPNNSFGNNIRTAVKTIFIRDRLRLRRQTLFIEYGGWDHHGELLVNQAGMLDYLDDALYAYQLSLEALGLADSTLSFTSSDFGRTLRSNGQGTDHAWSGHQFVFGAPVAGGGIHGTFPSLAIDGPDDIGRGGRLYPQLSVDEYIAELLQWFGITPTDMPTVLPNITNFYTPSGTPPLGFLT